MNRHRRSAIAIRHVAFEGLGLLSHALDREGWDVSFCEAAVEDLSHKSIEHADLLIVLGGPIGVHEIDSYPFLAKEIALLERRLVRDRPTLGICLGSQLMAKALGSAVFAGSVKEIGWGQVQLTTQGSESCLQPLSDAGAVVLHWHGDTFDLPSGALRLASNASYENQAFSYGRNAMGLQFHLEADPRQLEEWYVGHAVELAAVGVSVKDLRAATAKLAEQLPARANAIFTRWLQEVD
jgi:GMP synthase (glutamine-hydrolysing)